MPDNDNFLISPVYGTVIHRNFKPLYADERFAELYGFDSVAEVMAVPSLLEYIDAADREEAQQSYQNIMSGRVAPQVSQFQNVNKQGREIAVLTVERIVEWQSAPALQITLIDMTPRVEAEKQMRQSEQKFRDLAECSIQGMIVHRDFKPLYVNRAYATMHGYNSPEEIMALPSMQVLFAPDEVADGNERLAELMDGVADNHRLRLCNIRRDGSKMWVDLVEQRIQWNAQPAIQTIVVDVTQQHLLEEKLKRQASTDELTGLANRRRLMERFEELFKLSRRYPHPLSCILMDLDRFKLINDNYGHAAGDQVLRQFSQLCRNVVREVDFVGRYGGEEFLVILPETTLETAYVVAERLRQHTEQCEIDTGKKGLLKFTVSSSVAQLQSEDSSVDQLIQRADKGLYLAKADGRNRVWYMK